MPPFRILPRRFQALVTGDVLRVEDAFGLVAVSLGSAGFGASGGYRKFRDQMPDGVPVVFATDAQGGALYVDPRLLNRGSLAFVERIELLVVEGIHRDDDDRALAERAEVLVAAFGPDEARAMALVLHGDDAIVPPLPDGWTCSATDAQVAAARGATAPEFVRTLEDLRRARSAARGRKDKSAPDTAARRAADKAATATLVDVSAHKKLSEMHGFGEAGEWGVRLAADLCAYAQGELDWSEVDKGVLLTSPPGGGK